MSVLGLRTVVYHTPDLAAAKAWYSRVLEREPPDGRRRDFERHGSDHAELDLLGPVGRFGNPEEVARVVEFLVEPESGYITGQVYSVNGGLYM